MPADPLNGQVHPSIPCNEELHEAAGFDQLSHGKDCEKRIYCGNTQQHIYTYKYIFAHAFSLGYIYYCLGLAITFNQSFKMSSYELSTKPSLIWVLGSCLHPPLETKLLGFGKPSPSIWAAHFLRDSDLPWRPFPLSPF